MGSKTHIHREICGERERERNRISDGDEEKEEKHRRDDTQGI